jgi:hypothetical protein
MTAFTLEAAGFAGGVAALVASTPRASKITTVEIRRMKIPFLWGLDAKTRL